MNAPWPPRRRFGSDGQADLFGELATQSPTLPDRQAERHHLEVNAGLRQRGAGGVSVHVMDLSTHGFRARTHLELAPGTDVWLKLNSLESLHARVAWTDGLLIGCQFMRPLHPAVLDMIVRSAH